MASLLKRVGARNHCISISLRNCSLDGSGLAPLSGSLSLRSIDLRRGQDYYDYINLELQPSVRDLLELLFQHPLKLTSLMAMTRDKLFFKRLVLPAGCSMVRNYVSDCARCFNVLQSDTQFETTSCGCCESLFCDACSLTFLPFVCDNCFKVTCVSCSVEMTDEGLLCHACYNDGVLLYV